MATPQVLIEIGTVGQKKVEKEINTITQAITRLEKAEKGASKESKKGIKEKIRELKSEKGALLRNQKALISNRLTILSMVKTNKLSGSQLGSLTNSYKANTRILTQNNLTAVNFNRSQGKLRTTVRNLNIEFRKQSLIAKTNADNLAKMAASTRKLEKGFQSNKAKIAASNLAQMAAVTRRLENRTKKTTTALNKGAKSTKGLNTSLKNLSSTAVLTFGPLSGIGSRIIAMSAIFSRGNIIWAIAIATFVALSKILTGGVSASSKLEQSTKRLNAVLKNTGRFGKDTAEGFEAIAKQVDRETLASIDDLRQAMIILATAPGVTEKSLKSMLLTIADLSEVMAQTFPQTARLFARVLQDPVANMDAFNRAGKALSPTLRNVVKNLVSVGDKAGAANVIIANVAKNISGAAKGGGGGLKGAVDSLAEAWTKFNETIGGPVIGVVTGAVRALTVIVQGLTSAMAGLNNILDKISDKSISEIKKGSTENIRDEIASTLENISKLRVRLEKIESVSNRVRKSFSKTFGDPTKAVKASLNAEIERLLKLQALLKSRSPLPKITDTGRIPGQRAATFEGLLNSGELSKGGAKGSKEFEALRGALQQIEIDSIKTNQAFKILNGGLETLDPTVVKMASKMFIFEKAMTAAQLKILIGLNPTLSKMNKLLLDAKLNEVGLKIFEENLTSLENYNNQMGLLNLLLKEGKINWETYQKAQTKAVDELIAADPILSTLTNGFDQMGASMLDAFRNGASAGEAFKNALSNILQELAKMVFQLGVINTLKDAIFGGDSSGKGGIFGGILKSVVGGLIGGGGGPNFDAGPGFNPDFADFAFAHGGSFNVGGSGGTDSQNVSFRATPNERVTVETPAQQKSGKRGGGDTFIVDMRGASVEAVTQLEKFVRQINGSIEKRAISAVSSARSRNPNLFGSRSA